MANKTDDSSNPLPLTELEKAATFYADQLHVGLRAPASHACAIEDFMAGAQHVLQDAAVITIQEVEPQEVQRFLSFTLFGFTVYLFVTKTQRR